MPLNLIELIFVPEQCSYLYLPASSYCYLTGCTLKTLPNLQHNPLFPGPVTPTFKLRCHLLLCLTHCQSGSDTPQGIPCQPRDISLMASSACYFNLLGTVSVSADQNAKRVSHTFLF